MISRIRSGTTGRSVSTMAVLLAANHHPGVLYLVAGGMMILLTVIIWAAALSRRRYRRSASLAVLRLLAELVAPGRRAGGDRAIRRPG